MELNPLEEIHIEKPKHKEKQLDQWTSSLIPNNDSKYFN